MTTGGGGMDLDFNAEGIDEAIKELANLPGVFSRARVSALKSVGFHLQRELRNHIEYGGAGGKTSLHPLTQKFKKKYGTKGKFKKTRRGSDKPAFFWLGKFARYRVDPDGQILSVDFGKSNKGKPGTLDRAISAIAKRAEAGEKIAVTPKMRRLWASTKPKRPKDPEPGVHFFPLRADTRQIEIPARPIFKPVWRKMGPKVPQLFSQKFWGAIDRYLREDK